MPLSGSLKTVSLTSILQLLSNEKQTGILRVTNQKEEYQIFILEGNIIYAIKSLERARLGELMVRGHVITRDQLNECLDIAKKEKLALGKILVQKGYVTSEILKEYIYKQVEEVLFSLFLWNDGEFNFDEAKLNLKWLVVFKLNIMKLIMSEYIREILKEQECSQQLQIMDISIQNQKSQDIRLEKESNLKRFPGLVTSLNLGVEILMEKRIL